MSAGGGLYSYSSGSAAGPMLRYSRPAHSGREADYLFMWWNRDWMVLARSSADGNVDEFLKDYLTNVSGPK